MAETTETAETAAAPLLAQGQSDATPVQHVEGLKASAARVQSTEASRLVRRMLAHYGRAQLFEWYRAHTVGKPVFDVDGRAADTTATALLAAALAGIDTFFGFRPDRIVISASHGGEKLSYRVYVPGYRMRMADQKARLVRLGLDKNRPFDAAIYGSQQKLRMTGSIKTPQDTRVLKLIDAQGKNLLPTEALLLDTLVQVVEEDWPLLTEGSSQPTAPTVPAPRAPAPAAPTDPTAPAAHEPPQLALPAPKRQRGRPRKDQSIPADHLPVLREMGFRNPRFTGARDKGYSFSADNRDRCPNCTHDHERRDWWMIEDRDEYVVANYSDRCRTQRRPKLIEVIVPVNGDFSASVAALALDVPEEQKLANAVHFHQALVTIACSRPDCISCDRSHDSQLYDCTQIIPHHCWTVRNRDNNCPGRIFHRTAQLDNYFGPLLEGDVDNIKLTQLFMSANAPTLHYNAESRDVYRWQPSNDSNRTANTLNTSRWRRLTRESFQTFVSLWFSTAFSGIKMLPDYAESAAKISKILARLDSHVAQIIINIKGLLTQQCEGRHMDANPHLLGTDNGVIDLKAVDPETGAFTTVLREARPEDLVTKSVGYAIPDGGFQDDGAVEAVFAQIYPVEEERRFFQLFGGYCLLGNHPAKGFMCLTDRRKGDNGKSTAVQLLRRALGPDYVIDNKQNLLYEARYATTVNAHDSGMMAFEGKRLAVMEELSANRTLDTSLLKQISGGATHVSIRPANCPETRSMLWSAKLITVFNEGCAPKFRVEDEAFTKRMIVVPHRAFFCKDDAARQAHAGEENTFDADGDKIEALHSAAILAWLAAGLERYWATGQVEFQPPASCREWAGDLVEDQDALRAWATETYEVGVEDDFVTWKNVELAIKGAGITHALGPKQLKRRFASFWKGTSVACKENFYSNGQRFKQAFISLRAKEI